MSERTDILQGLSIKTTNKFRKDIEGSEELLAEENTLRSVCKDGLSEHIIEHDAFHRVFINKIRRGPKYRFTEAVAWFLTHDSKLPDYDRVAKKGHGYLPFCITSDQWVQINRPLLARTANQEEYEESFHLLVTQPFLRAMMSTFSMEKAYNEVLGRLARYKSMNPQLAFNLVTDKHFMVTMALETDEEKIEEKIESKLVDMVEQLQRQKEASEKDAEIKYEKIEKLQEEVRDIQRTVEESEKRVEDEKKKREAAEKEAEKAKHGLEAFKASLVKWIKWAGFVVGLGLTSLVLWLHHLWFYWPWLDTHKNKTLIELASQLLLVFALLNIPLTRYWKTWLGFIVTIALAILTLACS